MIVKLLTEHHLEFLSLKGGCTGLSESTLVKMSNCWKSRALAQMVKMMGVFQEYIVAVEFPNSVLCLHEMASQDYLSGLSREYKNLSWV